jgi:hypothetical protein
LSLIGPQKSSVGSARIIPSVTFGTNESSSSLESELDEVGEMPMSMNVIRKNLS